jgi:arsenate reductase (glutaredoxin)
MAVLVLHYAGCDTCRKARAWLAARDVDVRERPIVEQPPTRAELAKWIPASGLPVRKWLNVSGQSYRALGKERIAAMTDAQLIDAMTRDGKLVKRPVVVDGSRVLVGFDADAYADTFGKKQKKGD